MNRFNSLVHLPREDSWERSTRVTRQPTPTTHTKTLKRSVPSRPYRMFKKIVGAIQGLKCIRFDLQNKECRPKLPDQKYNISNHFFSTTMRWKLLIRSKCLKFGVSFSVICGLDFKPKKNFVSNEKSKDFSSCYFVNVLQ